MSVSKRIKQDIKILYRKIKTRKKEKERKRQEATKEADEHFLSPSKSHAQTISNFKSKQRIFKKGKQKTYFVFLPFFELTHSK